MSNSARRLEHRRRRRNPLPDPPHPNSIVYPEKVTRAEVIFIVGHPPAPGWWETRGKLCVDLLVEAGIPAAVITMPTAGQLEKLIEDWQPRVIVNRGMLVGAADIERLAKAYPRVKFVACNQSSYSYLLASAKSWSDHWAFFHLAKRCPNIYLTSPDERKPLALLRPDMADKLIWTPNPVRIPEYREHRLSDVPTVSLIAAGRPQKNFPTQLLAFAMAARKRPMRLLISATNGYLESLSEATEHLDIDVEFRPWADWPDYIEMLRGVDVCLQVSQTESFNYVALEHMLCGVPVVGSSVIRYLPMPWQAKMDDARDICDVIEMLLRDWGDESYGARSLSVNFSLKQNVAFQQVFRGLLDG